MRLAVPRFQRLPEWITYGQFYFSMTLAVVVLVKRLCERFRREAEVGQTLWSKAPAYASVAITLSVLGSILFNHIDETRENSPVERRRASCVIT